MTVRGGVNVLPSLLIPLRIVAPAQMKTPGAAINCKQALQWTPQGCRGRERPKNSWEKGSGKECGQRVSSTSMIEYAHITIKDVKWAYSRIYTNIKTGYECYNWLFFFLYFWNKGKLNYRNHLRREMHVNNKMFVYC